MSLSKPVSTEKVPFGIIHELRTSDGRLVSLTLVAADSSVASVYVRLGMIYVTVYDFFEGDGLNDWGFDLLRRGEFDSGVLEWRLDRGRYKFSFKKTTWKSANSFRNYYVRYTIKCNATDKDTGHSYSTELVVEGTVANYKDLHFPEGN